MSLWRPLVVLMLFLVLLIKTQRAKLLKKSVSPNSKATLSVWLSLYSNVKLPAGYERKRNEFTWFFLSTYSTVVTTLKGLTKCLWLPSRVGSTMFMPACNPNLISTEIPWPLVPCLQTWPNTASIRPCAKITKIHNPIVKAILIVCGSVSSGYF